MSGLAKTWPPCVDGYTPYYWDDWTCIYHGDCHEILPQLPMRFDLTLIDPPYGLKEAAGKNMSRGYATCPTNYGFATWDNTTDQHGVELAIAASKKAIVFGGNFYTLPPSSCWLVWDKDNGSCDFADCELLWTNLPKAVRRIRWRWNGMLQEHAGKHKEERWHPTQKPLAVVRWCLEQAMPVTTVLDAYMGSGTTLRAAKDIGVRAVGIEQVEAYCAVAVKRLRQEAFVLPMVQP